MRLELVRVGADLALGQDEIDVRGREVGDADEARLALADQLLQRAPGLEERRPAIEALLLLLLLVVAGLEGDGPVDEVQVQVADAQVRDGGLYGLARGLGSVVGVPELAGDPEVGAADA